MSKPRPVIIDSDPGVDDAIAILLALASPELDLLAITTVAGNVPLERTAANARKVCELAGRSDLAVHAGCERPLIGPQIKGKYSGSGGLGASLLPEPVMPLQAEHAVDFLIRVLGEAAAGRRPKPILCPLGPLTNLGVAFAHSPGIVAGVERIVLMGGAFSGGNRTPTSEFNIVADPHAAAIVMASGAPITMSPLDLTHTALATPARVAAMRAGGGRVAKIAAELLAFYDRNDPERYGEVGGPLHDPTVIGWLLQPGLYRSRPAFVRIETRGDYSYGQTVGDFYRTTGNPPNVDVLHGIDADGFFAMLAERIARLD